MKIGTEEVSEETLKSLFDEAAPVTFLMSMLGVSQLAGRHPRLHEAIQVWLVASISIQAAKSVVKKYATETEIAELTAWCKRTSRTNVEAKIDLDLPEQAGCLCRSCTARRRARGIRSEEVTVPGTPSSLARAANSDVETTQKVEVIDLSRS